MTAGHLEDFIGGFAAHGLLIAGDLVEHTRKEHRGMSVSMHTTENLPSLNHKTQQVPFAVWLWPVIHQDTIRPAHQEKPQSLPHTSSPKLKLQPSLYPGSSSVALVAFLSPASVPTGSGVVATVGDAGSVGCCTAGGLASSAFWALQGSGLPP